MGATNSTLSSEHKEALQYFTETEKNAMTECFAQARRKNQSSAAGLLNFEEFKGVLKLKSLDDDLAKRLYIRAKGQQEQGVCLPDIVLLKRKLEVGGPADQAAGLWELLDTADLAKDLERWARALLALSSLPPPSPEFLEPVCKSISEATKDLSLPSFQKALKAWPGLLELTGALTAAFPSGERPPPALPRLHFKRPLSDSKRSSLLLSDHWQALLASLLPLNQRGTWELLFNSDIHGKSFSSMIGKMTGRGPSLLVVRDKSGALFGGFAADTWEKRGSFFGQPTSFLFRLFPTFSVHFASGVNNNYQWLGYKNRELANGVGFGGQPGYFALFVNEEFDTGMSRPAATFDSPCLASSQVFQVDSVECWLVEDLGEEQDQVHGTAMDRFQEDNVLLQLHGKVNHSDGYRAEPPIE